MPRRTPVAQRRAARRGGPCPPTVWAHRSHRGRRASRLSSLWPEATWTVVPNSEHSVLITERFSATVEEKSMRTIGIGHDPGHDGGQLIRFGDHHLVAGVDVVDAHAGTQPADHLVLLDQGDGPVLEQADVGLGAIAHEWAPG